MQKVLISEGISKEQKGRIQLLVESSGFFSSQECDIALSLVDDAIQRGLRSDYRFLTANIDDSCIGFSCFGLIDGTDCRFDLYWIVIDNRLRGQGIGTLLLQHTEGRIRENGGKMIFIDTAGRPQYQPTRQFYQRNGYQPAAIIRDFYSEGDDKVIYAKSLIAETH